MIHYLGLDISCLPHPPESSTDNEVKAERCHMGKCACYSNQSKQTKTRKTQLEPQLSHMAGGNPKRESLWKTGWWFSSHLSILCRCDWGACDGRKHPGSLRWAHHRGPYKREGGRPELEKEVIGRQRLGVAHLEDERKGHAPRTMGDLCKLEKKRVLLPSLREGRSTASTLISDCWPPEQKENKLVLFFSH